MSLPLTSRRRIAQFFSLALLNTNFWSIASERVCLPVMNCEACALAWLGCPIGMMSSSIAFHEFPFLVAGILLGLGIVFGRFFCGWICPMGLLQDFLHKIPWPKFEIPKFLLWLKYVFLVITVIAVSFYLGKDSPFFFCQFCPTAAIQVVIPTMIADHDFTFDAWRIVRFAVLFVVLVLAVANHRSFCKIMCPIGALMALTNKFSLFSIRMEADKCVRCRKCDKACPMDVAVQESGLKGAGISRNVECVECLSCQQVCPAAAIGNNSRILK